MPGLAGVVQIQIGPLLVLVDTQDRLAEWPIPARVSLLKLEPADVTICALGPNCTSMPSVELDIWVICL